MAKIKRKLIRTMAIVGALSFFSGFFMQSFDTKAAAVQSVETSPIVKTNAKINSNIENYFDDNVVFKLPEEIKSDEEISVIVDMKGESVVSAYTNKDTTKTISEFVSTAEAKKVEKEVAEKYNKFVKKLDKSGVDYVLGEKYDTILSGFEITIKAKDFEKVSRTFGEETTLIIGDTYEPAATEVITNEVDVDEKTGIFDSSMVKYTGEGTVVAVLDTGLDYTHTAFSPDNFTSQDERFTLSTVSQKIAGTTAANSTAGLSGEDVYVNRKVPFAYDYADKDPDVLPINSEHGTHVAGIIAGKDDTIVGVAPEAQLAIMKVFSDSRTGAKTSWILAALEDCVTLGVDVINMSLGTSCGFTREVDKENVNKIYDSIHATGISLIVAASNDYNATHGSEKNGALGLTSNPDSGTVGSPATYPAALSVASVDGVKTPYILYGNEIIYFKEASTTSAKEKDFVNEILDSACGKNVQSHDFTYVTIPGVGRSSDYPNDKSFYAGKIVLVKRGTTTFEDKVRVALKEKGAAGIIIYNNVSGSISMSVGADVGAVCSIAQDEGELLAAAGTGIIRISRTQLAGPFMSDFSSWGPTSDLRIKPEITAHGGEILSAVPGQAYDRLSGTSMAAPNQAGATALIRQYVNELNEDDDTAIISGLTVNQKTALVNQLMMSTTDIVRNVNGLPYAVRKQGSGLVNIAKATTTASYITTFDENNEVMDKTKLELGDDKEKTGVYTMKFAVNNISGAAVTYKVGSIVMTEGVSETYTSHGDTTVTEEGYLLNGATRVVSVVGDGSQSGDSVTIQAKKSAIVTVEVTLSDADKKYLDDSFENGMYVEGFVTLDATSGTTVDINVPFLAFYGDWTQAPIFDEEYYDTHKDEINAGINPEDKLMADAYATRVIGGLYSDYITTLGTYYFMQDPSATQIAADKNKIAISNQDNGKDGPTTVNSISSIWAGLLRNVKEVDISIVENSTGKEIFNHKEYNQRKSYGISSIYMSAIDVDFKAIEHNLKNNTQYTVTVSTYIDYGDKSEQNNVRNVFEFPLYVDFEAPVITGVTYRTEYDQTTKKTKLFADLDVYDNHYAMGINLGQIVPAEPGSQYKFEMKGFGKYITPVYSNFNSTSKVTVELTDYVAQIKNSAGMSENGEVEYNNNSFVAFCYDYAMNQATYEIRLPDEILSMYFTQEELVLSPNETKTLSSILDVYPSDSWIETLDFEISEETFVGETEPGDKVINIVNQTLIAQHSGTAKLTAIGYDKSGNKITASLNVKVLAQGEDGYKNYDVPVINKFELTTYEVNKAYYEINQEDRKIGETGDIRSFDNEFLLSMYPSESVTVAYKLDSYFPDKTDVVYSSGNEEVATVDSETGTIVAKAEGTTIIFADVTYEGKSTLYSGQIVIDVKDPFITNAMWLMKYRGLGGVVELPTDRGFTTIYEYAFSNYEYVEKDLFNGDVIDEEDPYSLKMAYIGDDTITKVIIPEGVEIIEQYAFANLTALEEVVLPSTLVKIGVGAFENCTKLKKINLESVKFINANAFKNCILSEETKLDSIVAIGNYAFENCKINSIELPETSQSIGIGSFYNNKNLTSIQFNASKIKLGISAFENCSSLISVNINAAVIASKAFYNCTNLTSIRLGKDVAVIGEYAFAGTKIATFTIDENNSVFETENDGAFIIKKAGNELSLVAPAFADNKVETDATAIGVGAFAGKTGIFTVIANNAKVIGDYAFADCTALRNVSLNSVETVGSYAFMGTSLVRMPENISNLKTVKKYAFAGTKIDELVIPDNVTIEEYAFANCNALKNVTLGNKVKVGDYAFYSDINLQTYEATGKIENLSKYYERYTYHVRNEHGESIKQYDYYRYNFLNEELLKSTLVSLTAGTDVKFGEYAFAGNVKLENLTLGSGAIIGDYAFYNAISLDNVDFSGVVAVGNYAFTGTTTLDFWLEDYSWSVAYKYEYKDGAISASEYVYRNYAPMFTEANLSSALKIGDYAFANNSALTDVIFVNGTRNGESLTKIGAYAFANTSIEEIILPATVTEIGEYAFFETALTSANVENVKKFGDYAFANTALTEITLKDGAEVGDYAFANVETLAEVSNLENVDTIGASAFFGTALTEVTLTNVKSVGDFAFGESKITKVTFGVPVDEDDNPTMNKLCELGENPFYGCDIVTFGRMEQEKDSTGKIVGTYVDVNYFISDTIKLIDDVLYQIVPTGLELISYPMGKADASYVIVEDTTRITAKAFAGSKLENVTLPSTLRAIGDKAFYGCDKLAVVVFKSYDAPILEEEFDTSYISLSNLAMTGTLYATTSESYTGLGIAPFYMWNSTSDYTNFYYGANFVNRIGHIEKNVVMVVPANGKNYDSFIFGQYFKTKVLGSNAATKETITVIGLISALPKEISLANEAQVLAARAAYDQITSYEQLALITNYETLTNAEATIKYLKQREEKPDSSDSAEPIVPEKEDNKTIWIALTVTFGVLTVGAAGFIVFDKTGVLKKLFKKKEKLVEEENINVTPDDEQE